MFSAAHAVAERLVALWPADIVWRRDVMETMRACGLNVDADTACAALERAGAVVYLPRTKHNAPAARELWCVRNADGWQRVTHWREAVAEANRGRREHLLQGMPCTTP